MQFETNEIERIFNKLMDDAINLCDNYLVYHMKKNAEYKNNAKLQSYLTATARKKTGMCLAIVWTKSYFLKRGGKNIHQSKHIAKGKGSKYNTDTLIKHAPEWEHSIIIETEKELGEIRASLAQLTKIGIHARLLNKRLSEIQ